MGKLAGHVEIKAAEFQFLVDGEPFPYLLATAPSVTRVADELHVVRVEILPLVRERAAPMFIHGQHENPQIADSDGTLRPFPWLIHESGIQYRHTRAIHPVVELAFLARTAFTHDVETLDASAEARVTRDLLGHLP